MSHRIMVARVADEDGEKMPHQGQEGVLIDSSGNRLLATLFLAQGDEPKPTVLLLHGLPGIEKNYDLALGLRELGWNALLVHYRGCWGSEGAYSLLTLGEDARAALDYLTTCDRPQIDPGRVVLVGHSMGGYATLEIGADDRVRAAAVYGPVTDPAGLPFDDLERARELTSFLSGISPEGFVKEWNSLPDVSAAAREMSPTPLLVVHGEGDEVVPIDQSRRLEKHLDNSADFVYHPDANHAFTWHRSWLRDTLLGWLMGLGL